ncbi:MAG TPA: CmpA/NrtA family ABC transporter substrate-binding protein [Rhodopila sp.]|nr:CmpA/NrtA family ABC transporter substrate-binding protein [Rhodopila sp.]
MSNRIRIGVLRLVDSAPVIVAEADDLFEEQGLDVTISIEPSWANIADKLTYGVLDAAVMLPPLALAACAGLRGPKARLLVPMSLSQGGNAITVRTDVADALVHADAPARLRLLDWLHTQRTPPRFAVVHTFSTHNLLLRYWLASGGADPDRDIETVVIPPEDVGTALAQGSIAGFCAGAPWGGVAERSGAGRILIGTSAIWPFHPEKCLCVGAAWAESHPDLLIRLQRALLRAQIRCDDVEEAPAIAALLADPEGLRLPEADARAALPGGGGAELIRFHSKAAWFPARAHAEWFIGQMQRWGWMPDGIDTPALARTVYRPDLLAPAIEEEGLCLGDSLPALESTAMLPRPSDETFASTGRE